MQKEFVTPITHLEDGESVYLPLPCYMKAVPTAMAAYDTHGTVVRTHMVDENMPHYAEVFFPAIDGMQMLARASMARKVDGSIVHCHCHDIGVGDIGFDKINPGNGCDCGYTSIAKTLTQ